MADDLEILTLTKDDQVANANDSQWDRGNHKSYWMRESGRAWPSLCRIKGCGRKAEVGAHVFVKGRKSNNYCFILPMCKGHNGDSSMDWGEYDCWRDVKARGSHAVQRFVADGVFYSSSSSASYDSDQYSDYYS